jgi:hypothetical protein
MLIYLTVASEPSELNQESARFTHILSPFDIYNTFRSLLAIVTAVSNK